MYTPMYRAHPMWVLLLFGALALAQRPTQPAAQGDLPKAFDVVSIKPGKPSGDSFMRPEPGGRFSAANMQLRNLVMYALNVGQPQLEGLPNWANDRRYSIEAIAPPGTPDLPPRQNGDMERSMVRAMLVQYFRMKVHHETKQEDVFDLVVAKGGPKLKEASAEETAALNAATHSPQASASGHGHMGTMRVGTRMGRAWLTANSSQLSGLVATLSGDLGKVIVDQTGLTGYYSFALTWTPVPPERMAGGPQGNAAADDSAAQSVFAALENQLGLTLKSGKGPVDVVVIDHIEPAAKY